MGCRNWFTYVLVAGVAGCNLFTSSDWALQSEAADEGVDAADAVTEVDETPDADAADEADVAPVLNACGGDERLRHDGAEALPGDPCGACGHGTLVCNGIDALRCVGDVAQNACGGCGMLEGAPGASCGPCGDGVFACDGGAVACVGAGAVNTCGGCAVLADAVGAPCGPSGFDRWTCSGPDAVSCLSARDVNACGGVEPLVDGETPLRPEAPCDGPCGSGRWVCDTATGSLRCDAPGANACGGCGPLAASPGTACGCDSAGTWRCDDAGDLACVGGAPNACGGCDALDAEPGDACGGSGSVRVCSGVDATVCTPLAGDRNPCGGLGDLSMQPGTACGSCGSGTAACTTTDSVRCEGDAQADAFNGCGGCASLDGPPASPCGACAEGAFVCDGEDNDRVACDGDPGDGRANACGGCAALSGTPGAACGTCAVWRCVRGGAQCVFDDETLSCVAARTCADLDCAGQFRDCVPPADGAEARCGGCSEGRVERDGVCVTERCTIDDDCEPTVGEWSDCAGANVCTVESQRSRSVTRTRCESGECVVGESVVEREDCEPRATDGEVCGDASRCSDGACVAAPGPPTSIEASSDRDDQVRVQWEASARASHYEIAIDGGEWIRVDGFVYADTAAPAGTLTTCAVAATDGAYADRVALACTGAETADGTVRSYEVRAVGPGGTSATSVSTSGRRAALRPGAPIGYRWERAPGASAIGFETWADAPSSSEGADTSTPFNLPRSYRVTLSAGVGVTPVESSVDVGFRGLAPAVATGAASPISDVGATLSAQVTDAGGADALRYAGFCVRAGDTSMPCARDEAVSGMPCAEGWTDARAAAPGIDAFDLAVAGLLPDTSHAFCAYADNGLATAYGAVGAFTTLSPPRCGDGIVNRDEACDGDDGRRSCASGVCSSACACVPVPSTPDGFVYIAPHTFCMGSPNGADDPCDLVAGDAVPAAEPGRDVDERQHLVEVSRGFFMGATEVTRQQWLDAGGLASTFGFVNAPANAAAERMSWQAAMAFANAISPPGDACYTFEPAGCESDWHDGNVANDGTDCNTIAWAGWGCRGYRLPTEAEWELAVRAGTDRTFYWNAAAGDATGGDMVSDPTKYELEPNLAPIGWYGFNAVAPYTPCTDIRRAGASSCAGSMPVATREANAWGLYDMSGNVQEWVWDRYAPYDDSVALLSDPVGGGFLAGSVGSPGAFGQVMRRGGNWFQAALRSRSAERNASDALAGSDRDGFRLARSVAE